MHLKNLKIAICAFGLTGLAMLTGCNDTVIENQKIPELPQSFPETSANRTIDIIGDDMAGGKTLLEWQEAIFEKIRSGDLSAYNSPALDQKISKEDIEGRFIIEELFQVVDDPSRPETIRDSIAEHKLNENNIQSIRIADSIDFQNDELAYSAKMYAIAPVLHLERGIRFPKRQAICWIAFNDLQDVFGKEEARSLEEYLFNWFDPNP